MSFDFHEECLQCFLAATAATSHSTPLGPLSLLVGTTSRRNSACPLRPTFRSFLARGLCELRRIDIGSGAHHDPR